MKNSNLTNLEIIVLEAIAYSCYHNDCIVYNPVWSELENNSQKGAFVSLVKKGFAGTDNEPNEPCHWITETGVKALIEVSEEKQHLQQELSDWNTYYKPTISKEDIHHPYNISNKK